MNNTRVFLFLILFASLLWVLPTGCSETEPPTPPPGPEGPVIDLTVLPYDKLSDYQFFTGDLKDLTPNARVLPYDLNTPLFSDYAGKARFIWMPSGRSAEYTSEGILDFPIGAILIKNFYFDNDIRNPALGRKILETRLLIRQDTAWQTASYIWNDEQTEADFSVVGQVVNVEWTHFDGNPATANYLIPNKNECKGCHNLDSRLEPLGPKTRNLNKTYAYASGPMNQLDKWKAEGMLSNLPGSSIPFAPEWDDPASGPLSERARIYLDINCAHCHNVDGPAKNSGLLLTYEETDSTALGICKPPVAAGQGSGAFDYDVVPGNPDESIMIFRMNSIEPEIAMPELARSVVHEEGLQLIREWIAALPGNCN